MSSGSTVRPFSSNSAWLLRRRTLWRISGNPTYPWNRQSGIFRAAVLANLLQAIPCGEDCPLPRCGHLKLELLNESLDRSFGVADDLAGVGARRPIGDSVSFEQYDLAVCHPKDGEGGGDACDSRANGDNTGLRITPQEAALACASAGRARVIGWAILHYIDSGHE